MKKKIILFSLLSLLSIACAETESFADESSLISQEPTEQQTTPADKEEKDTTTYSNPNLGKREVINFYPSDDDHPEAGRGRVDRPYLKMIDDPSNSQIKGQEFFEVHSSKESESEQKNDSFSDPSSEKIYSPVQNN